MFVVDGDYWEENPLLQDMDFAAADGSWINDLFDSDSPLD
jgi:hypothetical protein